MHRSAVGNENKTEIIRPNKIVKKKYEARNTSIYVQSKHMFRRPASAVPRSSSGHQNISSKTASGRARRIVTKPVTVKDLDKLHVNDHVNAHENSKPLGLGSGSKSNLHKVKRGSIRSYSSLR